MDGSVRAGRGCDWNGRRWRTGELRRGTDWNVGAGLACMGKLGQGKDWSGRTGPEGTGE